MFLFYVADVEAHRSGDPFLCLNETVMKRTVYLKFKDYPFVSDLKVCCAGVWDEDLIYDPFVSKASIESMHEHDQKDKDFVYDVVVRTYKVVDILNEISKAVKAGQLEPESDEVANA